MGKRLAGVGAIQATFGSQTGPPEEPAAAATGGETADLNTMDRDPVGLKDNLILKLRASVKTSRKLFDDHILEIGDHIEIVEKAKNDPNVPKEMVSDYSQQLKDLLNNGDILLMDFETKNALLLEKLDYLILMF